MKNQNQNSIRLDLVEKKNIFSVPEGYFVFLPLKVSKRLLWGNKLLKQTIYKVPEDYFSTLSSSTKVKILKESPLSNPVFKEGSFLTPEAYFEELKTNTEDKLASSDLPEIVKENALAVPEGYFESLSENIQIEINKKGKIQKVDFTSEPSVWYAAAASVALLLLSASFFLFLARPSLKTAHTIHPSEALAMSMIASLDKKEIKQYLEKQGNMETHELIEFASEKKKEKIKSEFEQELLSAPLNEKEKQDLELEMSDVDVSELTSDI